MKILIPIDGSECCKATLAWASQFLSKEAHQIYLVNVLYFTPDAYVSDAEVNEGIRMLEEARKLLEGKGFNVIKAEYVLGTPSQAICNYADENGIEQIMMGSHGRRGLAKFLMGSVSEGVFKHARQPVFIFNNFPPVMPADKLGKLEALQQG